MRHKVYLASKSPRRKELLEQVSIEPIIIPTSTDERILKGEDAKDYAKRVSIGKAESGIAEIIKAGLDKNIPLISCDTTVVIESEILGKPSTANDARNMLMKLSGKTHQVFSSITVYGFCKDLLVTETCITEVSFKELSSDEIDCYISTSEPFGKAGSYAIQGYAAAFISNINGSYSCVMGLPLFETIQMLRKVI